MRNLVIYTAAPCLDEICVRPCPYKNEGLISPKVGSHLCRFCDSFAGFDYDGRVVLCNFEG